VPLQQYGFSPLCTAILVILAIAPLCEAVQFPYAENGNCDQGCQDLALEYPGQEIQWAYWHPTTEDGRGHLALIVDGQLIDSFLGPVDFDVYEPIDDIFPTHEAMLKHITRKIE
jgi:hypothetical protein